MPVPKAQAPQNDSPGPFGVRVPDRRAPATDGSSNMAISPNSTSTNSSKAIPPTGGKLGQIIRLLQRTKGATIDDLVEATGWQPHSVRGAISGQLKKRHGLDVTATNDDTRGRIYRLPKKAKAGGAK